MRRQRFAWRGGAAVLAAASLALTACGSGDDGNGVDGDNPTVTVQVIKDARAKPMAEMPWTKDLEEACGCTIVWQETASSSWAQQKQASLAAGEIADVTIGGYGSGDWGDYNTFFLDLSTELESMPNLKATFEGSPFSRVVSTWDGRIFGAPGVNTGIMVNSSAHLFINKQWLDALGLEEPTSWSEFKAVLEAFKTGDPNGNGQADEIPFDFLAPSADGWGMFNPNVLLGSYGITVPAGGGNGMYAENGVVKNYLTEPAYKDFTAYMNELWDAGVIASDVFTHDFSQYISRLKGEGDTALVGATIWWTPSDAFGSQIADQYVTLPTLVADNAPDAARTWFFNGDGLNFSTNKISVSAAVTNKEAALKIVDAFYTPDIGIQARYGSFDIGVTKNGEKDYTVISSDDPNINASDWQFQNSLSDGAPGWFVQPGVKLSLPKEQFEVRGVDATYADDFANIDLNADVIYGGVSMTADETREFSLNNTGISQTAMAKFAEWVTNGGVDADWDTYVADLERNNLSRQVEIIQGAYDRFVQLMNENGVDLNTELNDPNLQFVENGDGTATVSR